MANQEQHPETAKGSMEAFLSDGQEYDGFRSSNVAGASYNPRDNYLEVGFRKGGRYGYHDVTRREAESFYNAGSKGNWVWDHLRVRGTVFGYRKPYAFIGGKSRDYAPKYYGNDKHREEHRDILPSGHLPNSWLAGKGPYDADWAKKHAPHPGAEQHPMRGASPHPHAEKHPMGDQSNKDRMEDITRRKVPMAYHAPHQAASPEAPVSAENKEPWWHVPAPAPKNAAPEIPVAKHAPPEAPGSQSKPVGLLKKAVGTLGGWLKGFAGFGGKHMASGGEVPGAAGVGENEDEVPIRATKGEYVVPKGPAQANKPLLDSISGHPQPGGNGHYAGGGDVYGTAPMPAGSGDLKDAADALKAAAGDLVKAAKKRPDKARPVFREEKERRQINDEIAQRERAKQRERLRVQIDPEYRKQKNAQDMGSLFGTVLGSGAGPLGALAGGALGGGGATLGGVGGAAGGAGTLAAAAGPVGAAAVFLKEKVDQTAASFHKVNDSAIRTAVGFAEIAGVPKSIAQLGGDVVNLFSPLRLAAGMVGNLSDPLAAVKGSFEAVAKVGVSLAKVFWDLRDPAAMLGQTVAPFRGQVEKYNPGAAERLTSALDNLSAAAGRFLEPIVTEVTGFANELNVLYTAIGPELKAEVAETAVALRNLGREVAVPVIAAGRELLPVFRNIVKDVTPFVTIMVRGTGAVVGFVARLGGLVTSFGILTTATDTLMATFLASSFTLEQVMNRIQDPTLLVTDGLPDFQQNMIDAMEGIVRMREQAAVPIQGPQTFAATPARHVGIEEVGLEARRSAFSMGADAATQTANNTESAAASLVKILTLLNGSEIGNFANAALGAQSIWAGS